MTRKFADLIKDFPPERLDRIERRKKELEDEMGVRITNLDDDTVVYHSDLDREGLPRDGVAEKVQEIAPRLEEHNWINPLRPDKFEKIVLDDEALAKLREVLGNWNGQSEEEK